MVCVHAYRNRIRHQQDGERKKEKQPENVRWFVCLVSVAARVFEEEKKKVKKEKMRTMGKDSESRNSR